ncbi:MAG: GDSL-type esterase/lipase family protein [Opitutaceae bacterium]
MKKLSLHLLALMTAWSFAIAQTPAPSAAPAAPAPAQKVDASAAIVKPGEPFQRRHESFLARGKAGPIGVLFLGDSITEGWGNAARAHIWEKYYGQWQPANFGIGGDQTQHVIWRIENGELDGIKPKVVVLMIGTNNTGNNGHNAEEIAAADKKIVGLIRAKIPEAKVLLLAIFPRGASKNRQTGLITEAAIAGAERQRAIINAANAQLAKLDDGKNVRFLDIGAGFLGQDGKIPFSIMNDQLHLSPAGYQLWADAMQPLLSEMMK